MKILEEVLVFTHDVLTLGKRPSRMSDMTIAVLMELVVLKRTLF